MAIDIGKILKTSQDNYFNLTGENPLDYCESHIAVHVEAPSNAQNLFAQCVTDRAEVVVGYKEKIESARYTYVRGTALVPKNSV